MPEFLGAYDEDDATLIVTEDLSDAAWPPPWSSEQIDAVLAALDALHRADPPEGIDNLDAARAAIVGWPEIAANPKPFLSTRLCTAAWLERALPELVLATDVAPLDGPQLLHFDVRSDNLCLRDGQALLFDWNLARLGNGDFDVAFWLPSLALEGGPSPWELLPDAGTARSSGRRFLRRSGWTATSRHCSDRARVPARPGRSRDGMGHERAWP